MENLATPSHEPTRRPALLHRKGRGAQTNASGRFESQVRVLEDDGWDSLSDLPDFKTEVRHETARKIITRNDSPDIGFDRSINPYRGCEHGCVYCFARPSHAYLGMSPGLDFESKLTVKTNAADILRQELAHPDYTAKTIALGANTDPYQPIEREFRITRNLLEVLADAQHPVAIVTKSALVQRDIDLLAPMAEKGLVKVAISLTTLSTDLARTMEPRATTPQKRLETIAKLSEAGIPTTVLVAPVIPTLNDDEIERILDAAYLAGARNAGHVLLRLPHEIKDLFQEWLLQHRPDRYHRVMKMVRELHGGKLYDATWHKRQTGDGVYAWTIARRFEIAMRRLGYRPRGMKMRTDLFQRHPTSGQQLSLL